MKIGKVEFLKKLTFNLHFYWQFHDNFLNSEGDV